jgi:hypothetical protein
MKLVYDLSHRQRKELTERGRALKIALLLPDEWDTEGDPLRFARGAIGHIDRSWVRSAEIIELPVVTPLMPAGTGLVSVLGEIAHVGTDRQTTLIHRVLCVVAELAAVEHPRHDSRIQWPAAVVIDGQRFPRTEDPEEQDG